MKHLVVLLILFSFCYSLKAQNLPMEIIANHLIKSGEVSPQKRINDVFDKISIGKYFEINSKAFYCFSSNSVHRYYFILMRNNDSFQILNCENFIREYEIMEKWFSTGATDSLQFYISPIIRLYQHNYNYHPSPPIAPLIKGRNGEFIEPKYLARKLIHSNAFKYPINQKKD